MKPWFLLLLVMALAPGASVRAQGAPEDTRLRYPSLYAEPFPPDGGVRYVGEGANSVYLIGAARYRFYQRLHRHLLGTAAYRVGDALRHSYARSLHDTQRAYDRLLQRYRAADRLATRSLSDTRAALAQLQGSLDQTRSRLAEAERALYAAEAQQRAQRRRSFRRGMAYGGGAGATLLILLRLASR